MQRRRFLQLVGAAAAWASLPIFPDRARATTDVAGLDLEAARSMVGRKVLVTPQGGWPQHLVLESVQRADVGPAGRAFEQYSLIFRGKGAKPGRYRVELDAAGCCDLHLLPAGPREEHRLQAACSRRVVRA